jgi:hypothetical protein
VVRGAAPDGALVELGVLEAGDQRARPPLLVPEDEVPRALVVVVHGLLHEPHAEHVPVERQRALHVGDQERDVVDARDPQTAAVHLKPSPPERRLKTSRIA